MKQILLTLGALTIMAASGLLTQVHATQPLKLPGSNTVLQGALNFDERWAMQNADGSYPYPIEAGIYNVPARADGKIAYQHNIKDFLYLKAGIKMAGGIYYAFTAEGSGEQNYYFSSYSSSTWTRRSKEEIDKTNIPSDLTYDPVTKTVYGFFWSDEDQEFTRFCSISMSTAEAKDIGKMDRNCFAIAANSQGEIYGIFGYTGWLIKVNPKSGKYEQIGKLGIYPGEDSNTLTFDTETGKLFWTTSEERDYNNKVTRKAALFEVDTASGKATLIREFPNNESFAGMYALPYTVPADGPAECTDISVTYPTPGSLTAEIGFTTPQYSVGGTELEENLDIEIIVDGRSVVAEGIAPGARTSVNVELTEGINHGTITPCTSSVRGVASSFSTYAGEDIPGTPTNLSLTERNGKPHLSWGVPETGLNGGSFDPSLVRYRIVREPDHKEVVSELSATEWTDSDFNGMAALSYAVYAGNSKGEGLPAVSDKLVFGNGFTIPFTEGFNSEADFDLWTVINPNGKTTWQYSSSDCNIYSRYDNEDSPADDWIFSPHFDISAGHIYRLEFDAYTSQDSNQKYAEDFEWWLASSASSESKIQKIASYEKFIGKTKRHLSTIFKADADGKVHLGLFTNSPGSHWQLNIDNIQLSEVDSHVPAAVSDLHLSPAPQGALSVTLTCKAPVTDADGRELTENMSVSIYREQETTPAASFSDIAPGYEISWIDTPSEAGIKSYRVVAMTLAGEGEESVVSTFVGIDAPGAPIGLSAEETDDGVVLTWTTNESGANGGWFDISAVSYRIVRSDGEVLHPNFIGTTYTDSSISLEHQELLYYLVTPYCGNVKGAYANTPSDVYGPAYPTPAAETFAGADMKWYPWISESDGPHHLWTLEPAGVNPSAADSNGDGGMVMFSSDSSSRGIKGKFSSPKFDASSLQSPALSFSMYHSEALNDTLNEALNVYCKLAGGVWELLTPEPIMRDNGSHGWQMHTLALPTQGIVRVMFEAVSLGGGNIHIDDIRIGTRRAVDAEVVSVQLPRRAAVGETFPIEARISNSGYTTLRNVEVKALTGEAILATASISSLESGESKVVNLDAIIAEKGMTTITLKVYAEGDSNSSNDTAQTVVEAVTPIVPGVGNLAAQYSDDNGSNIVTLSWDGPADRSETLDNFESYADWSISGIGDWITTDRDRDATYHINKDLDTYPDMNTPKAWQVCNAHLLGIDIWPQGQPVSGNKMLMCMSSINVANDDWLISPLLNGAAQTISFYAKAFTNDDGNEERMAVYVSDGSTDPDDFSKVSPGEYIDMPDSWQRYEYPLSTGTRRFAIRCMSAAGFSLFVDDARFNDLTVVPVSLLHYEVIRDGQTIATTTSTTYVDEVSDRETDRISYRIKAVYDRGLEALSEDVDVICSRGGVDETECTIRVYAEPSAIVIEGAAGLTYELFIPGGTCLSKKMADAQRITISVSKGIYLLRIGGACHKVMVR